MTRMLGSRRLSDQPEREVTHVQQETSAHDCDVLRALKSSLSQGPEIFSKTYVQEKISKTLGQLHSSHQEILTSSLQIAASTFGGCSPDVGTLPLWIQLLPGGKGLRQVPAEWRDAATNLLIRFGLPSPLQMAESVTSDPFYAQRMGMPDLAARLLEANTFSKEVSEELRLRIKIFTDVPSRNLFADCLNFTGANSVRESLLASLLVRAQRAKMDFVSEIMPILMSWVKTSTLAFTTDDERLRACHVINSMNFVHFAKQEFSDATFWIDFVRDRIVPKIENAGSARHVLGNNHFHRSMLFRNAGKENEELRELEHAAAIDTDFCDYDYRMAMIEHNRGNQAAKAHYERALSHSPFSFSLVNDYGCFLADSNAAEELESWTKPATHLFPAESAGGTS